MRIGREGPAPSRWTEKKPRVCDFKETKSSCWLLSGRERCDPSSVRLTFDVGQFRPSTFPPKAGRRGSKRDRIPGEHDSPRHYCLLFAPNTERNVRTFFTDQNLKGLGGSNPPLRQRVARSPDSPPYFYENWRHFRAISAIKVNLKIRPEESLTRAFQRFVSGKVCARLTLPTCRCEPDGLAAGDIVSHRVRVGRQLRPSDENSSWIFSVGFSCCGLRTWSRKETPLVLDRSNHPIPDKRRSAGKSLLPRRSSDSSRANSVILWSYALGVLSRNAVRSGNHVANQGHQPGHRAF